MKKSFSFIFFILVVSVLFLLGCATIKNVRVADPKVAACQTACDEAFNKCLENAKRMPLKRPLVKWPKRNVSPNVNNNFPLAFFLILFKMGRRASGPHDQDNTLLQG